MNFIERDRVLHYQKSFRTASRQQPAGIMPPGPYGAPRGRCQFLLALLICILVVMTQSSAFARTLQVVAFGDSLSAGYLLPEDAAFPAQLEQALRADGFDAAVANAGVSGDTTSGGLDRLDWSVPEGTDLAIVELGANDMLRGLDPALVRANLEAIVTRLLQRKTAVLLAGMYAAPNLGQDYGGKFASVFSGLARQHHVPLYPFFLAGVAGKPELQLPDGLHPTREGVAVIVKRILPDVEAALKALQAKG